MRKPTCLAVTAALSLAASWAGAVTLNPHGIGQVLIYPYYTVNGGSSTLLSVVNTTARGKALKLHFREGYNGRDVLAFNLYLSPYDVWVAQIADTGSDGSGPAALATRDSSCTVPPLPGTIATGAPAAEPFRNYGYTGTLADGGPADLARTREGYVEFIEMGEVTNAQRNTLSAIEHDDSGQPADCAQLVSAWTSAGYWTANAGVDLAPPGGGLYGVESIINVAEGTIYAIDAIAIDGFSDVAQHTAPGEPLPDLGSASRHDGVVRAFVPVGAGLVQADYDKPEDAISALFMAGTLFNEFVVDAGVGARSDWIVTFPTKRFYTDPALVGAGRQARAPFDATFTGFDGGTADVLFGVVLANREESQTLGGCGFICPSELYYAMLYATNAIRFGRADSALRSQLSVPTVSNAEDYGFAGGQARVNLTADFAGNPTPAHALVSSNGITFDGLPAIGFLAVDYVNANVTPGVLANYSGAYPHRSTVRCTNSSSSSGACP